MSISYVPKHAGTIDAIVNNKMKVLSELCVADNKNYDSIRSRLVAEIHNHPDIDKQRIVDRVAKTLIYERFNKD